MIVPELMQNDCTAPALANALLPMLRTRRIDPDLLATFRRLHESLLAPRGSAAAAVADLLATGTAR
jgi:lipid A disaccharide synthetase